MAKKLAQCKDCGKEVSKSAKTCPHCGANKPVESIGVFGVVGFLILLGVLVAIFSGDSEGLEIIMKADQNFQEIEDLPQLRCKASDGTNISKKCVT